MDLLSPGAILKQLSLGVSFGPTPSTSACSPPSGNGCAGWIPRPSKTSRPCRPTGAAGGCRAFLERNRADHCSVAVALPRREVLLRQLELPLEARENLARVVDYQLVNLLPSEEQAVATDTLAVREESDPPRLRVTLFVVLRSTLERALDSCRELGLAPDRVLPAAVALADYLRANAPGAAKAPSLVVRLDKDRGELAGLVEGQLRLCKEFRYDSSNPQEALESEIELFRGEAGLGEEASMKLFLAGDGDVLGGAEERLPVRTLSPPRGRRLPPSLGPPLRRRVAGPGGGLLRLQAQGRPGRQPAALRGASP